MPDTGLLPDAELRAVSPMGRMVVIGLGYVGRPLAQAAAAAGFDVTGHDTDPAAVAAAAGQWRGVGSLAATADPAGLPAAGAWLICVPTPLDESGRPDLSAVTIALETCRANMPRGAIVTLVSTCQPGATNGMCRRILERDGWRVGRDVFLAVSPERENPGAPHSGPRDVPRLLGAPDPASLQRAMAIWSRIAGTVVPVASPEIAECAKLLENTYRLVNIALMDELHRAFTALGVPTREVVAAAATKPFGFAPFWPGLGAGGHCIPVDPAYLQMEAARAGAPSAMVEAALIANARRPEQVLAAIRAAMGGDLHGRRLLVLGVTYKPEVADLRGAAPVALMRALRAEGAAVAWHDPLVTGTPAGLAELPRAASAGEHPDGPIEALVLGTPHGAIDLTALAGLAPLVFDPFGSVPRDPAGRVRPV